jgi:colicin import membrane protein
VTPPPPAEAQPIAAPQPEKAPTPPAPKPEPKPDLKAIAAKEAEEKKRLEDEKKKAEDEAKKKAEEAKKKAEEDKKRKAEDEKKQRDQILKDALKAAADEAKKKEKADSGSVQKELDALRKQVGSGSGPAAATAAQPGSGSGGGGGPAGSTGTGIGSIAAYGRVVEQLIKANWRFPSATAKNPLVTQVEIRIAVDGSISGFRMLGSSGRPDYDASALRAVQDTKTLPPPPSPDLSVLIINFNNQE